MPSTHHKAPYCVVFSIPPLSRPSSAHYLSQLHGPGYTRCKPKCVNYYAFGLISRTTFMWRLCYIKLFGFIVRTTFMWCLCYVMFLLVLLSELCSCDACVTLCCLGLSELRSCDACVTLCCLGLLSELQGDTKNRNFWKTQQKLKKSKKKKYWQKLNHYNLPFKRQ